MSIQSEPRPLSPHLAAAMLPRATRPPTSQSWKGLFFADSKRQPPTRLVQELLARGTDA